jgi:hypothetical protein
MEQPALPFEHRTTDIAVECLANLGVPQLSEGTLASFAMHYQDKGLKERSQLFHVFANSKHGGGLQMLLSAVAANFFINDIPDETVRMSLFRLSEEEIYQQRIIEAGAKLGISKFKDPQLLETHATHIVGTLTQFQEKLLQRVSPTDPGMRR